ncbi:MAG: hypothetical protein K2N24_06630 [Lachnospiraceae bacterium]|nr:hypothetical protein [Lachnospiraceae bacterium]
MDSKGEVPLTNMVSLEKQESQSLSQNVKLGLAVPLLVGDCAGAGGDVAEGKPLQQGKKRKKRVCSSKYALSSIV